MNQNLFCILIKVSKTFQEFKLINNEITYLTDFWISLLIFVVKLKSKEARLNNCFLEEARIDFWGVGSMLMVKG